MLARISKYNDTLNPILVKELRQAANGKFFRTAIILTTLFLFAAIISLVCINSMDPGPQIHWGETTFYLIHGLLTFIIYTFVPLWVGHRYANERHKNTMELFYSSTLSPQQIIFGKLCTGLIVGTLLYTISLPFLNGCYLMRGIDTWAISISMLKTFILFWPLPQAAIFVGAIPVGKNISYVLLLLLGVAILFYWSIAFGLTLDGGTSSFSGHLIWIAITAFASFMATGFFYVLAIATILPPTNKRIINKSSHIPHIPQVTS